MKIEKMIFGFGKLFSLSEGYYGSNLLIVHHNLEMGDKININDLPKVGIVGVIKLHIDLPNGKTKIVVEGVKRVKILSYNQAETLEATVEDIDLVIHLAAETGTGQSMYEVNKYIDTNIGGTSILLDKLVNEKLNVKKLIIASSRSIYGEGKYKCVEHGIVYP